MNKREIKKALKGMINDMEKVDGWENEYMSVYLGSFMSLDPCGRFHSVFSPNGITSKCEKYWERLEDAANELEGWTETGEGDPTDIFFCMSIDTFQEYQGKVKVRKC